MLSRDARYRASESTRISIEAPDHWLMRRFSARSRRPAVCDADFDFEGCRVADVVAGRQRMGYDIDVEQKVVARPGFETCAAAAGIPGGLFPQVRADVGDMCLGRCEAGAVAAVSKQPHISATL